MSRIAICGYSSSVGKGFISRYDTQFEFVKLGRRNDADISLDLRERALKGEIDKLRGCDVLINLSTQVDDATDQAILDLVNVNVLGALYLAEICHQYQIPQFINMSSISATYRSDDAYYGFYAQSKKSAEEFLECYCKRMCVDLCILRPAAIYGEDTFAAHQRLLYGMMEKVKKGDTIMIYGNCDAHRNYIHISTLSEVIAGVIREHVTGIYNVVCKENQTLTEIVADLNHFYHKQSKIEFLTEKPDIIERVFQCDESIYEQTGVAVPKGIYDELSRDIRVWK